jgi:hypothetical protein
MTTQWVGPMGHRNSGCDIKTKIPMPLLAIWNQLRLHSSVIHLTLLELQIKRKQKLHKDMEGRPADWSPYSSFKVFCFTFQCTSLHLPGLEGNATVGKNGKALKSINGTYFCGFSIALACVFAMKHQDIVINICTVTTPRHISPTAGLILPSSRFCTTEVLWPAYETESFLKFHM